MSRKRLREIAIELYDMTQLPPELNAAVQKSIAASGDEALCFTLIAAAASIATRMLGTQSAFHALHHCMRCIVAGEEEAIAQEAHNSALPPLADKSVS